VIYSTQKASRDLAKLYKTILEESITSYPNKSTELSHSHLIWMCQEVINNHAEWPIHKSNRWIGYVQGVLSALQVVSVDTHRDITRKIVEKYNI